MRETKLPELNEEFLKKLHIESEAELRKNIRQHLEEAAVNKEKGRQQDEVCEFLLKKTKLDVPESAVKEQARNLTYELARQRMMRGMSQDQIKAQSEDMFKEAQEKAEEQVKLRYIVMAVAEAEAIKVEDQEVSDEVVRMAVQQRQDATEYRKKLEKEDQLGLVADQLRFTKTIELLLEKAKIK
jgi:trigger factor